MKEAAPPSQAHRFPSAHSPSKGKLRKYFTICGFSFQGACAERSRMMKSALEELAHSNFFSENYKFKDDSLYAQAFFKNNEKEKKLRDHLDEEQVRLLNEYCDTQSYLEELDDTDNFIYGFTFGVRMMIEVFQDSSPITGARILDD